MYKRNMRRQIDRLALSRGKMAFISGPRQVGKTTLAKVFMKKNKRGYYNWDDLDFRRIWTKSPSNCSHLQKSQIKEMAPGNQWED